MEEATKTKVKVKAPKKSKPAPLPVLLKSKQIDLAARTAIRNHIDPTKVKVTAALVMAVLGIKPAAMALALVRNAVDEGFKSLRERCDKVIADAAK